jgi:hypothetical protein
VPARNGRSREKISNPLASAGDGTASRNTGTLTKRPRKSLPRLRRNYRNAVCALGQALQWPDHCLLLTQSIAQKSLCSISSEYLSSLAV